MASSTLGIGLTIGAVAQGSVGAVLGSTRRTIEGLTRSSRALEVAQTRIGRSMARGLPAQRANYERLGAAMGRVRRAHDELSRAAVRSNTAIAAGQQSWGKLATTAMAAWGTVKGVVATAGQAANFADTLRDTRIKGQLSAEQEVTLGDAIRVNVATTNQSRDDLAAGAHQLLTGGAGFEEAQSQIGLMGATMTALRTSSEETTGAMLALRDMGATDRESMQGGIERLIAIGQQGQFTPDMMVRAFAQLGDTIKATGMKGDEAIAELAAGLQIAEGAMGGERAQAGLQSWLTSLNDKKIAQSYESAGVDYAGSMAKLQQKGLSQYQASLELAGAFIRDRLSTADQQALIQGDDDGRIGSMLSELGLGEVFKDANAARFALSIHNNKAAYQEMTGATGAGSLEALKALREESPVEQMRALKNTVSELAVDIGNALLPSVLSLTNTIAPLVAGIADFVRAHPGVVTAIGGIVAGIVAWRVASVAGMFAFRQTKIVVLQIAKGYRLLRAGLAIAQAQMALFRSGTLLARGALLTKLGAVRTLAGVLAGRLAAGLRTASAAVLNFSRVRLAGARTALATTLAATRALSAALLGRLTLGLRTASIAALGLGRNLLASARAALITTRATALGAARTLGGALASGLKVAGRAALWLGRALMMNPIGLAVTAIAGAAYLLIKYWQPVSGFFKRVGSAVAGVFTGMWTRIKAAFSGGIVGVSKLVLDWSPLGLFYKAFAGVAGWFGVELPEDFSEFGGKLISAFTSGIFGVFDGAWQGVTGLFESAWQGLTNITSGALDGIKRTAASAWQHVTNVTTSAWNGITSTAESVWGGLTGFFGGVWNSVSSITSRTWDGIGTELPSSWTSLRSVAESTWTGIGSFFGGVWDGAKTAFDGGIGGVSKLLETFSPLTLMRRAFAGVMTWFKAELPEDFKASGKAMMDGLIGGITNMVSSVRESIVGIGESVTGWFRDKLGINSPSRVFMALGANVSEGAALGITGSKALVKQAALGLAAATAVTLAAPTLAAPAVHEFAAPVLTAPAVHELAAPVLTAPAIPELAAPELAAPAMPELAAPVLAAPAIPELAAPELAAPAIPDILAPAAQPASATIRPAGFPALPDFPAWPEIPPVPTGFAQNPAGTAGSAPPASVVIHFSPTIHVQGAADTGALEPALSRASQDLQREVKRILREQHERAQRRAYGQIGQIGQIGGRA